MRAPSPFLLILGTLIVAGCTQTTPSPTPTPTVSPTPQPGGLPAPISDSQSFPASADPLSNAPNTGPCTTPAALCYHHTFNVTANATITADLTWTVPANDLDLFLLRGTTITASSTNGPPSTAEKLTAIKLTPGSYDLVVSVFAGAADTLTLKATFATAAAR